MRQFSRARALELGAWGSWDPRFFGVFFVPNFDEMEHPLFMTSAPNDKEYEENAALGALAAIIDEEQSSEAGDQNITDKNFQDNDVDVDGMDSSSSDDDSVSVSDKSGLDHLQQDRPSAPLRRRLPTGQSTSKVRRPIGKDYFRGRSKKVMVVPKNSSRKEPRASLGQVQISLALTGL